MRKKDKQAEKAKNKAIEDLREARAMPKGAPVYARHERDQKAYEAEQRRQHRRAWMRRRKRPRSERRKTRTRRFRTRPRPRPSKEEAQEKQKK